MSDGLNFRPMKVHKNLFIKLLTDHPEEVKKVWPDFDGTSAEMIEMLKADPHEWFVDGKLCE